MGKVPRRFHIPPPKPPIDLEEAERLYVREGLSYKEIGDRMGYRPSSIRRALLRQGIRKREASGVRRTKLGGKIYLKWIGMRTACRNPRSSTYKYYGGQGAGICRQWRSFESFHDWALHAGFAAGLSLILIDRTKDFSPENCRWGTRRDRYRRFLREHDLTSERRITAFGETKTVRAWVRDPRCTSTAKSILRRLARGYSAEEAVLLPPRVRPLVRCEPRKPRRTKKSRPTDREEVRRLHVEDGLSIREIASELGREYTTIHKILVAMGCQRKAPRKRSATTRGRRLYKTWLRIHGVCEDPDEPGFEYYGGKGLEVCGRWSTFDPFYDWAVGAGHRKGLCLTLVDRGRGFSPENCIWTTRAKSTEFHHHPDASMPPVWTITALGETKGPTAWGRDPRCEVTPGSLVKRLRRGFGPEAAITTPRQQVGGLGRIVVPITAFGETKSLAAWERDRRCRVTTTTLRERLERGLAPEDAIALPAYSRSGNSRRRRPGPLRHA
jgi:DNA-directed RNA polymerase specialized sigma24 family protein